MERFKYLFTYNNLVNSLQKAHGEMVKLNKTEIMIMKEILKHKEGGISITQISKNIKIDLGNCSGYVNRLMRLRVVKSIGKSPRLLFPDNPEKNINIIFVMCDFCKVLNGVCVECDYIKCNSCKKEFKIRKSNIKIKIKEELFNRINLLMLSIDNNDYDDFFQLLIKLYEESCKKVPT